MYVKSAEHKNLLIVCYVVIMMLRSKDA